MRLSFFFLNTHKSRFARSFGDESFCGAKRAAVWADGGGDLNGTHGGESGGEPLDRRTKGNASSLLRWLKYSHYTTFSLLD